jgi:hypothetical protein
LTIDELTHIGILVVRSVELMYDGGNKVHEGVHINFMWVELFGVFEYSRDEMSAGFENGHSHLL